MCPSARTVGWKSPGPHTSACRSERDGDSRPFFTPFFRVHGPSLVARRTALALRSGCSALAGSLGSARSRGASVRTQKALPSFLAPRFTPPVSSSVLSLGCAASLLSRSYAKGVLGSLRLGRFASLRWGFALTQKALNSASVPLRVRLVRSVGTLSRSILRSPNSSRVTTWLTFLATAPAPVSSRLLARPVSPPKAVCGNTPHQDLESPGFKPSP